MRTGVFITGVAGNNGSTLAAFLKLDKQQRQSLPGSIVRNGTVASLKQPVSNFISEPDFIPIRGWEIRKIQKWKNILIENDIIPMKDIESVYECLDNNVQILKGVGSTEYVNLRAEDPVQTECSKLWGKTAVEKLKTDIDDFATQYNLDHVSVIYSGSTEQNVDWNFKDDKTWPPSVHYAMAALDANVNCSFVNAAAQISVCEEMIALFDKTHRICIICNDLSTGQTKLKRNIADMFLSCGFPLRYVASTNYLSNLDGFNLQGQAQNKSKILTKSSMIDACVSERPGITNDGQSIPHHVNIAYVEGVGDDKLALDEYNFNLAFNKNSTLSTRMLCKDTLLALPLLFDLCVLLPILTQKSKSSVEASNILAYYFKNIKDLKESSQFLLTQLNVLTEFIADNSSDVRVKK